VGRSSSSAGNRVSRLAVPHCPKTCLRSEEDLEGWYVKPADWYEAHDVELRTGSSVVASAADVYAAGDVANHLHPVLGRIRVEHYNSAEHHGAAAARAMLGSATPFDYIHNFWSDQYEHTLQYVGHAEKWDDFVVRGSLEERKLVGFYLLAGIVRAAVGFDRGGDPEWEPDSEMAACARLVALRARPDRGLLTDEHTDLRSLVQ
jgi:3-phenylpropionate/trans-cinnamate dioxygenase ferredoxin reductase subunit